MDLEWYDLAACSGLSDIVDFFPNGAADSKALIADYCMNCKVMPECAAYALEWRGRYISGVWGGVYLPPPGNYGKQKADAYRKLAKHAAMLEHRDDAA